MQKEIEILCLEHNEKIVSFSLDSQPKCQKCLPKNDLTVEQFVEIVDQQRKKKISSIQQEQSASQKYFAQIKKQLLINKEIYVQGINKLISLIEKQMQQIQIDMQGQITELSKPIQSLQTSKLKEYFKNNDSIRTDNLFGKKISEIQFALNKEYKQLQRETGITNILYRMGDMNNPLFLNDYRVCVPGEQNSEPANIKTIPSGGYTRQDFMPLYTFCPNQESCADNRTAQWYSKQKYLIFKIDHSINSLLFFFLQKAQKLKYLIYLTLILLQIMNFTFQGAFSFINRKLSLKTKLH